MKKRLGFDLILLGDPTSGKNTQAELLSKKYQVRVFDSGTFLRKHHAKQYVSGGPAPSNLIYLFLKKIFSKLSGENIVFVGAARLKPEAVRLAAQLKKRK